MFQRTRFQLLLLLAALFLSACGSGGGGQPAGPGVAAVNPADQATNVPVDSSVQAKFSTKVDPVTVNEKNFFILDTTGQMAGAVTYEDDTAVFKPSQPLGKGKQYSAVLTTGIKDLDGVALSSNFTWSFSTEGTPGNDTTAPTVISTIPQDSDTDVPVDAPILVIFSESINPSTLNAQTFFVKGITGAIVYDDATHRARLTPSKPLAFSTTYQVTLTKGITDAAGNPLAADQTWEFTTRRNPDTAPPRVVTEIPADKATGVATNTKISVTFDENVDDSSLRTRFILNDLTGATIPTTFTYDQNSKTGTLAPTALLESNKTYNVAVKSGVTDLSGNATPSDTNWSFTTLNIDTTPPTVSARTPAPDAVSVPVRSPITVTFSEPIDSATLTGNFIVTSQSGNPAGQINYDATLNKATFVPASHLKYNTVYRVLLKNPVIPGSAIKDLAGNNLADPGWSFTTVDAPVISSKSPDVNAQNVPTNTTIQATFNHSMNAATINLNSFKVVVDNSNPVSSVDGLVGYDDSRHQATFTPTNSLAPNTTYRVTLTTAIEDAAGNPLESDVTDWTFTTAQPLDSPPTVNKATSNPPDGATNVSINISSIIVRFDRPVDKNSVQGHFLISPPVNGSLCPDLSCPDPQTIVFNVQGPLSYDTPYTVTLDVGIRSASGAATGGTQELHFRTEAAPDTTPPTVVHTDPTDQSTNVPSDDQNPLLIRVDFSEAVAPASVTPTSFHVQRIESEFDKPDFPGSYTFSGATVTFTPSTHYRKGKTYQVTLTAEITDLAGNQLQAPVMPVVFSFNIAP
ncbi:MAG: Ig-like domain-containing protein [Nitrospirae bacterium]|nr:Ig-like domain-containing protein [Candidatus Manganitrophaceae bacterium]